jgi:hypothetical protein
MLYHVQMLDLNSFKYKSRYESHVIILFFQMINCHSFSRFIDFTVCQCIF